MDSRNTERLGRGASLRIDGASAALMFTERVDTLRGRLEARMDVRKADAFRSVVREARSHVKGFKPGQAVSQATASRYRAVVDRMESLGFRPEDASCRASFEFRRAALVYVTRSDLKARLSELDRSKRAGKLNEAGRAFADVGRSLQTLRAYPPSTGNRALDMQRESAYAGPGSPVRSNGKRESVRSGNLPESWQDQMQASAHPADRPALAAMAATGCRPVELRGLKVYQDDAKVTFVINGAKVDANRGIPVRSITLDKADLAKTQPGQDLQDWLGQRSMRTVSYEGSCEALRDRIARAAARADLIGVSSYSYRHAAAQELRSQGASRTEIGQRLGHRSVRSSNVYG